MNVMPGGRLRLTTLFVAYYTNDALYLVAVLAHLTFENCFC